MPQFDIFSFFSQLFWVFLAFIVLYLLLTFYILPAIGTTLKIRKRKLSQVSSSKNVVTFSSTETNAGSSQINTSILDFSTKLNTVGDVAQPPVVLLSTLSLFSIEFEALRNLKFVIFNQLKTTMFLFD